MKIFVKLSISSILFLMVTLCSALEIPEPPIYQSRKIDFSEKLKAGLQGETDSNDVASSFRQCYTGEYKIVNEQTSFRINYDAKHLYLQVHCEEPAIDKIKTTVSQRDGKLWEDDCIEIFISADEKGQPYYQFILNSSGTLFDSSSLQKEKERWNSNAVTKVARGSNWWGILLAIPWSDFRIENPGGRLLRVNVCRTRRVDGTPQLSAWSPTKKGYHEPERFGYLVLGSFKDNLQKSLHDRRLEIGKGLETIGEKLKKHLEVRAQFDEKFSSLTEKWQKTMRNTEMLPDNMAGIDWQNSRKELDEIGADVKQLNVKIDFEIVLQ